MSSVEQGSAESQMVDLQTRLAYQEDTRAQLNQIVTEQDSNIQSLQVQVQTISKKIEEMSHSMDQRDIKGHDERPPHY